MPIPGQAMQVRCQRCGWTTRIQPKSDALDVSDLPPTACPRCGATDLAIKPMPDSLISRLLKALGGRGGATLG